MKKKRIETKPRNPIRKRKEKRGKKKKKRPAWKGKKRESKKNGRRWNGEKERKKKETKLWWVAWEEEEQRKSKNKAKNKSGNEREESCWGVGWHGFDNTQNVGSINWVKLRKCHLISISITQKHLKLVSSFCNSLLKYVRIEWMKQIQKTKPNKLMLHGTHHFWVMSERNCVMSDGNIEIQTTTKSSLTFPWS